MWSTLPPDEASRIHALERLGALKTPDSPALEALCALTSLEVVAPLVRIDLVDHFRVVPKAVCGGPPTILPRRNAIAAEVVRTGRVLVIPDLMRDPKWSDHPDVHRGLGARMCIAMPIRTSDAYVVGALVAIDVLPRHPDRSTIERMFRLTCQIADQLHKERPAKPFLRVPQEPTPGAAAPHLAVVAGGPSAPPSMWALSRDHVAHTHIDPWAILGHRGRILAHGGTWSGMHAPSVGDTFSHLVHDRDTATVYKAMADCLTKDTVSVVVGLKAPTTEAELARLTFVRRPMGGGMSSMFVYARPADTVDAVQPVVAAKRPEREVPTIPTSPLAAAVAR